MASPIRPTFTIERELLDRGYRAIAGVDEAGRGALAGPLALGLVIYDFGTITSPPPEELLLVDDSKKMTPRQRVRAYDTIQTLSCCAVNTMVSHRLIDRININKATEHALLKSLESLSAVPDIILLDGTFSFNCPVPIMPVKKGDSISLTIASASIVAKVHRDAIVSKYDSIYPGYDFSSHKGYGTKKHIASIKKSGVSPVHRMSYDPVKSLFPARNDEN